MWRCLDSPGHEAARLLPHDTGWRLAGTAVFGHEGDACSLDYVVGCDAAWRTVSATLTGWVGKRAIDLAVVVDAARRWSLNGSESPDVAGCFDIDLAFSPSTNTLPIRRLSLAAGASVSVRAAWLTFPDFTLQPLDQVYHRVDPATYRYESGGGAFRALLRVNPAGLVVSYPELWEAVPLGQSA